MKISQFLFNASILIAFSAVTLGVHAQTTPACTTVGGVITDTAPSTSAQTSFLCTSQPDLYQVKIYRVAICTAAPTAPTAATAFSAPNCTTIFENTSGASVDVNKGVTSELTGTITRPADGVYVGGYVEMAPQFGLKVSKEFGTPDRNTFPASGVGKYCWSVAGNYYSWASPSNFKNAACGTTATAGGLANVSMNGFPDTSGNNASFSYSSTVSGQQVGAYLVKADKKLPASGSSDLANGIERMIGVATFASSVTIDASSTGYNTQFDVSSGTTVLLSYSLAAGNKQYVDAFTNGPFSIVMTVKQ